MVTSLVQILSFQIAVHDVLLLMTRRHCKGSVAHIRSGGVRRAQGSMEDFAID